MYSYGWMGYNSPHIWVFFNVSFVLGQLALVTPTEKAQNFNGLTQWRFIPAQVNSPAGQATTILTDTNLILWSPRSRGRRRENRKRWRILNYFSLAVTHLTSSHARSSLGHNVTAKEAALCGGSTWNICWALTVCQIFHMAL